MQTTGVQPVAGSAIRRVLETSPFPILLVCLVGIVLLSVFAPAIVVGDTWLTLMAGREVVENGLPHTEHLTVLGEGRTWTDQQWLAQVVFYAAHGLAGMRAVILLGIAFVLLALGLAFATARTGGASSRSTFVIGFLAILAGPWGWTLRAQTAALPLFAGVLWLLVDAARRGVRSRTLLVLPLLVLWANLHGSVVLGAGLAMLLGLVEMVRARTPRVDPAGARRPLPPLRARDAVRVRSIVAYYDLMLVDAPFAPILREWQWSSPSGTTALFWLLALVAAGVLALRRCRGTPDLLRARRPRGDLRRRGAGRPRRDLVRARRRRDPPGRARRPPDEGGHRGAASSTGSSRWPRSPASRSPALAFVARPASWFVSEWPEPRVAAVREATRDPSARVWATDGTADWLLWRIPDLRGRIAYDVRFELYDEPTLDRIVDYGAREGDWRSSLDGYASSSSTTATTSRRSPPSPARASHTGTTRSPSSSDASKTQSYSPTPQ